MSDAKVMIIIGDKITGYELGNMEKFSIKLKNGVLKIEAVERHTSTLSLKEVGLLPPPSTSPTTVPDRPEQYNANKGKISYKDFNAILEDYEYLQENGEQGDIKKLFARWSQSTGINASTLHVWFSQAKKCLANNKQACKSLNTWIGEFCDQYKQERKEEFE